MTDFGKYRIELYRLLYEYPICKYPTANGEKEFNVLILGSGYVGDAAFRACLWAGVYPDSRLNITIASKNAEEYKARIFSVLPALHDLTSKGTNLTFVEVDDLASEDQLSKLDFENNQYRYVIIALGNHDLNYLVGDEVKAKIVKSSAEDNPSFLINMFDEYAAKDCLEETSTADGLNYFGKSMDGLSMHELMNRARNIHFSYTSKYNQRASKKKCDEEFDELFRNEFLETEYDDYITAFVGNNYNADSSLASAVGISSKLYYCSEYSNLDDTAPIDILIDAVNNKNFLYNKLVQLEHRRWVAYMCVRGYRMPRPNEYGYIYRNGNNHQTKGQAKIGEYFHICMCDCGEKLYLSSHPELWDMKISERPRFLSELDYFSLFCNDIAKRITNEVYIRLSAPGYFSILDGKTEFYLLRNAIDKMFRNEDNALAVYTAALKDAELVSSEEQKCFLSQLDSDLKILKIRNQRIDFFEYDAQLIDMLPFCIWYGNSYSTVITISDNVLSDDVIVPTLLNAPNAIFLGSLSKTAQNIITDYFTDRGGNTEARFQKVGISVDAIASAINAIIRDKDIEEFVINCTSSRPEVLLALGRYVNQIPILKYDKIKGLINFKTGTMLCSGLESKSFTVEEYIKLCKGEVINANSGRDLSKTEFNALVSIYSEAMKQRHYTTITYDEEGNAIDNKTKYIPWNYICEFFNANYKSTETPFTKDELDNPACYTDIFSEAVFSNCKIGVFLSYLLEYHIISDLTITSHGKTERLVSFMYVNPEVAEVLSKYAKSTRDTYALTRRLNFDPYDGIKESNLCIIDAVLYNEDEPGEIKESKERIINKMCEKGLIADLNLVKNEEQSLVSFTIDNDIVAFYLKDKGHLFELVVYEALHNSGLFDGVQTGVRLSWDIDYTSSYDNVKESLKSNKAIGYSVLSDKTKEYPKNVSDFTENEVDVIAIKGMSPIFVSCKAGASLKREYIYEIDSISQRFNAFGVLSVFAEPDGDRSSYGRRARQTKISLLGIDIINDERKTKEAFKTILNGGCVNGFVVNKNQEKTK